MRCEKCGYQLPENGGFCPRCGAKREVVQYAPQSDNSGFHQPPALDGQRQNDRQARPMGEARRPVPVPRQKKTNQTMLYTLIGVGCGVLLAVGVLIFVLLSGGQPESDSPKADQQLAVSTQPALPTATAPETMAPPETTAAPTTASTAAPTTTQPPTVAQETVPIGSCYVYNDPYSFQGDYLCPDSAWRYLTEDDVAWMNHDREYLQMAINEIYARHGYRFQTEQIRRYFESRSWYYGTIDSADFTEDMLNKYELYNISFLAGQKAPE